MFSPASSCSRVLSRVSSQQWVPWVAVRGGGIGGGVSFHTGAIMEAARKGTRAKADAKKKKQKKVEVKREFIPFKKRLEMQKTGGISPRRKEHHLKEPIDNVWVTRYYKWKVYNMRDALEMHRESHHPSLMGLPHSHISAFIELDLTTEKKNRFLDSFTNVVKLPHEFETNQERTVMVISSSEEVVEKAREMGVTYAGGLDIVKQIQNGEINVSDYEYVLAEAEIVPDLIPIRGLMKKRFPNVKNGTAGSDLLPIIERFTKGLEYESTKDKFHHDYGTIEIPFGRLSMLDDQLEENLVVLLNDIQQQRRQMSNPFITMITIRGFRSPEQFKIDHTLYTSDKEAEPKRVAADV